MNTLTTILLQDAAAASGGMSSIFMIVALIAVFYFFMIRPQVKKAKQHFSMVEALKVGDRVMTKGGIYGKVTKLVGEEIDIEVAPNVNITINRMAVETLVPTVSKENEKTTKTPKKTTTKSKK